MPTQQVMPSRMQRVREALRTARLISRMLQGTMGLEGQALTPADLKKMTRKTARELLNAS